MSGNLAVKTEEQCFIKSNGLREELLTELHKIKANNLYDVQVSIINECEDIFCDRFSILAYEIFGLSNSQLLRFKDEHLKELGNLLFDKVKLRGWSIYVIFTAPVIGQIIFVSNYLDYCAKKKFSLLEVPERDYRGTLKFLRKCFGKDYFPIEELRRYLKCNS